MEHKDASLMNKLDYIESDFDMEDIVLKPSVELIPDEYEHVDNKAALVHIFRGEYKHDAFNTERLLYSLRKIGYEVPYDNVHYIRKKEQVQKDLDEIANNTEGKSCLLVLFLDVYKEEDKLILHEEPNEYLTTRDIWINFTGYKCPNLRNKPKIFIFHATKFISPIQHDAVKIKISNKSFYEVPAEADILIVYKKVEEDQLKRKFIQDLCNNIDKNGKRDDILTLVTQTDHHSNVKTLVISTFTKKFYFTPSDVRGHHWDLRENHIGIQEALDILHEQVQDVLIKNSAKRSTQAESGVSVTKSNSFRANTVTDSVKKVPPVAAKKIVKKVSTEKPPWRY